MRRGARLASVIPAAELARPEPDVVTATDSDICTLGEALQVISVASPKLKNRYPSSSAVR